MVSRRRLGGRSRFFRVRVENASVGTSVGGDARNGARVVMLARYLLRIVARRLHGKNCAKNLQKR